MTNNLQLGTPAHASRFARKATVLSVVVAVSLAAACFMALAQSRDDGADAVMSPPQDYGDVDLDRLERIFWSCDHAAATAGVDGPTGIACGNATEQFKQRRFDGDFEAMLDWWRANKDAMHESLSRSQRPAEEEADGAHTAQVDDYPMP